MHCLDMVLVLQLADVRRIRTLIIVSGCPTSEPPCRRKPQGSLASRRTICALSTSTSPIMQVRQRVTSV